MKNKENKLKIVACIQARMRSARLKNKALLKISGKTIIEIIFDRLKLCKQVDDIILATSLSEENDVLAKHAKDIGLKCHRGSEEDLVSRYVGAVKKTDADAFIKITADCPLVDPDLIDKMAAFYRKNYIKLDLVTDDFPPTYPDGLDADIVPLRVLQKLDKEIKNPLYREYFITYIMENPQKFKIYNFKNPAGDQSSIKSSIRLTLDYQEDLALIKKIFNALAGKNKKFILKDILNFFKKNSKLTKINENRIDKVIIRNIRSGVYHSLTKNNNKS